MQKVIVVAAVALATLAGSLVATQVLRGRSDLALEAPTHSPVKSDTPSAAAVTRAEQSGSGASPHTSSKEKGESVSSIVDASVPGAAVMGSGARSSEQSTALPQDLQQFRGRPESEVLKLSLNSDYSSYDKETLLALAKGGDVVALYKLFGKVSPRQLCELAGASYQNGNPMAYGLLMDVVLEAKRDPALARAYYYTWRNSGSDLAKKLEAESLRRTQITPEQDQRAIALSRQLQAGNDCGWAPGP